MTLILFFPFVLHISLCFPLFFLSFLTYFWSEFHFFSFLFDFLCTSLSSFIFILISYVSFIHAFFIYIKDMALFSLLASWIFSPFLFFPSSLSPVCFPYFLLLLPLLLGCRFVSCSYGSSMLIRELISRLHGATAVCTSHSLFPFSVSGEMS